MFSYSYSTQTKYGVVSWCWGPKSHDPLLDMFQRWGIQLKEGKGSDFLIPSSPSVDWHCMEAQLRHPLEQDCLLRYCSLRVTFLAVSLWSTSLLSLLNFFLLGWRYPSFSSACKVHVQERARKRISLPNHIPPQDMEPYLKINSQFLCLPLHSNSTSRCILPHAKP